MSKRLLVLARCRNEERQVSEFLDMCGCISDGVLFLDDHSTDNSLKIAQNHASVLQAWKSYGDSSAHVLDGPDFIALLSVARTYDPDWVLILDLDERVDPDQFNMHASKAMSTDVTAINLLWPYYNQQSHKWVYWGWGPNNDKNQVRIKFKTNVFLRFDAISTVPIAGIVKPSCSPSNPVFTNLVLQHLVLRPAYERLHKWERRLPVETKGHLGYDPELLRQRLDAIRQLPHDALTTDLWMESIEREHGHIGEINRNDFHINSRPTWDMLLSHVPTLKDYASTKKLI